MPCRCLPPMLVRVLILTGCCIQTAGGAEKSDRRPQYEFEDLRVPGAHAEEPIRSEVSVSLAADYLDKGALLFTRKSDCISCHTNGAYLQLRPALTAQLGPPSSEIRNFAIELLSQLKENRLDRPKRGPLRVVAGAGPTQVACIALGLAEWDVHVNDGRLSPETEEALDLMLEVQSENGEWKNADSWPPYESSGYHGTTAAAMAAATAPGWLENLKDEEKRSRIAKMKTYLRTQEPPHDFARLLLLWTSTRMPDLIDTRRKQELIEMVWKHQREDGGWSLRTFAAPEEWGSGLRAEKLQAEPEFENPPSDGHQTGLAVVVLRDAGIPAEDPRIQKAVEWLLANQRASGRWWTRSLNTDRRHYLTYTGTAYSLLALAKCNALPPVDGEAAAK